MITYSIGILPIIKKLKTHFPDVTQSWRADDARALGSFVRVKEYLHLLKLHGPV